MAGKWTLTEKGGPPASVEVLCDGKMTITPCHLLLFWTWASAFLRGDHQHSCSHWPRSKKEANENFGCDWQGEGQMQKRLAQTTILFQAAS
jgi:hypothetical protein